MMLSLPATLLAQTPGELAIPNYLGTPYQTGNTGTRSDARDPASMIRLGSGPGGSQQPYRAPSAMPRQKYNIRMGGVTANFFTSLTTTFVDNAFGATADGSAQSDLSLYPNAGMSLEVPISRQQALRFDVGVGYRYSLSHPELNALTFAPSSSTDYRLIIGDVLITFYDRVSSMSTPPPQVAGSTGGAPIDFARIDNQAGVSASWLMDKYTSLSAGYNYGISRGLNDSFSLLNLDTHSLTSGIYRRLHPYWTAGLSASYGWTTYSQAVQNGSTIWSIGPVIGFEPSPFLNFSLSVGYSSATFDQTGSIQDSSTFGGLTYSGSVSHTITAHLNHSLTFNHGINNGIGSNFSENTGASYGIGWSFHPRMSLHGGFSWNHFKQSSSQNAFLIIPNPNGPTFVPITIRSSQTGDVYQLTAGTGYQLTRKLSSGLSYGYNKQVSSAGAASFNQHSVTLTLSYSF